MSQNLIYHDYKSSKIPYLEQDVQKFKNYVLAWFLAQIIDFGLLFLGFVFFTGIISLIGDFILAIGIFTYSNRYTNLSKGKIVTGLLVLQMGYTLITGFLIPPLSFPEIDFDVGFSSLLSKTADMEVFINYLPLNLVTLAGSAVLVLITAYFLTNWFNEMLPEGFPKTKSYLIYGIFSFIGEIVFLYSLFSFGEVFSRILQINSVGVDQESALNSAYVVTSIGGITLFVAYIVLFVAGYKFYSRMNLLHQSIASLNFSPTTYPNVISPSKDLASTTQVHQDAYSSTSSSGRKFCGKCGSKIPLGNSFCENCGNPIN